MINKSIVTGLGAVLLICMQLSAAGAAEPMPAGPVSAAQVPALVEAAARRHLARWTESAGLSEPQFTVAVLPGTRPLAACRQGVTVEAADTRLPSRMRFVAICPGVNGNAAGDGWRYDFVVRAQVSARVVVAAADVPAGRALADEDVLLERHDISTIADSLADAQDAVGMSAKRTLRAGEVLRKSVLSAPIVVKRGDSVRIIARREQIEVSMAGEALDAGARGSVVRVRNTSGTVLRTRVTGAGTVEPVDMPATPSSPPQ